MTSAVPARVLYSDLDGTMVGPRGCFFRAGDCSLTLEPARALVELHRAGVTLVLVSGRTRPQLVEACRIFGADGFVGELGAVVGWDGGRVHEVLTGAMPAAVRDEIGAGGRTPYDVITGSGVVERLLDRYRGRLDYHAPWHLGHEADVMLRGQVEVAEAEAWLAEAGYRWLQLADNGVLPAGGHVYHLMPRELSKGRAVAYDLRRRGLGPGDAVAVGDSAGDLTMAPYVRELWLTANGAGSPRMGELVAAHPNVRLATAEVGLGWVEAVRAALA